MRGSVFAEKPKKDIYSFIGRFTMVNYTEDSSVPTCIHVHMHVYMYIVHACRCISICFLSLSLSLSVCVCACVCVCVCVCMCVCMCVCAQTDGREDVKEDALSVENTLWANTVLASSGFGCDKHPWAVIQQLHLTHKSPWAVIRGLY